MGFGLDSFYVVKVGYVYGVWLFSYYWVLVFKLYCWIMGYIKDGNLVWEINEILEIFVVKLSFKVLWF